MIRKELLCFHGPEKVLFNNIMISQFKDFVMKPFYGKSDKGAVELPGGLVDLAKYPVQVQDV